MAWWHVSNLAMTVLVEVVMRYQYVSNCVLSNRSPWPKRGYINIFSKTFDTCFVRAKRALNSNLGKVFYDLYNYYTTAEYTYNNNRDVKKRTRETIHDTRKPNAPPKNITHRIFSLSTVVLPSIVASNSIRIVYSIHITTSTASKRHKHPFNSFLNQQ